jgi:hypothetical protein
MAILWPSPTSPCRVDLLTASFTQVYNSVRCQHPSWQADFVNDAARDIWEDALGLRAASNLIGQAGAGLSTITNHVANVLDNNLDDVIKNVGNGTKILFDAINAAARLQVSNAEKANKSLIDTVIGGAGDLLGGAGDSLRGIIGNVGDGLDTLIGGAGDALRGVVGTVGGGVSTVVNNVANAVGSVINAAKVAVANLVTGAADLLGDIIGNVGGAIGGALGTFGNVVGGAVGAVRDFIGDLIHNVQTGIGGIVKMLSDVPGALFSLAGQVGDAVGGLAGGIVGGVGDFLLGPFAQVLTEFSKDKEHAMADVVTETLNRVLNNPDTPAQHRPLLASFKSPSHPIWMVLLAFALPLLASQVIGTITAPILQPAVQNEMAAIRPSLLGLGDAVQAVNRGAMAEGALFDQGAKAGYSDDLIRIARKLGEQLPTPTDLMDWRHRGIISDGASHDRLREQGWSNEDASAILDASEIIPPVGDLVRFAVREAFAGQVAFDGARGSGMPSRFVELAKQQGLDPEFARSYWAAHWELPSVTSVFAMYHRRLIDESQLRALLKEADFAPEWIERIIAVAYDPFTRVDIRRMRALGVLSANEVIDAYRDIGYSAENARKLAEFTERDIADSKRVETAGERDLTRADIVGAYADGILNRGSARGALLDLGYDADEAELILDREDIRATRAERKETRTAIVDQVLAGVIDQTAAQDKLNAAGYTSDEVKAALTEIERKLAAQIRQPTKADLDKFRKFELIDTDTYRAELKRLGYADRWIDAYVALGDKGESADG